jgi:hypothetical protein
MLVAKILEGFFICSLIFGLSLLVLIVILSMLL